MRFLPEYDNIALSHVDRSRVIDRTFGESAWLRGSILVDGFVAATWRMDTRAGDATLTIRTIGTISSADRIEVEAEATRLAAFLTPDARTRDVRIGEVG